MKLHLPKSLLSALVTCVSLLGSIATTSTLSSSALLGAVTFTLLTQEVQATDQTYIFTGDSNYMANGTAMGYVNGEDTWTLLGWNAALWNAADDNNVIRFVTDLTYKTLAGEEATLGAEKSMDLDSSNVNLGGFIVDAGATGYSFALRASGNNRNFVLNGEDSTNPDSRAIFQINEDFIVSSFGGTGGIGRDMGLNASVDATIAVDRVFTINANLAGGTGETFYVKGGGTLAYNDNASATATAAAFDWHISEASTLKLTGANATGNLSVMLGAGSMSLDSGTLHIDSANATSLTNHIIVGSGGGTIQGSNASLDGRITYTTTPTTGGNALTLNGSFTLGAGLVIDLGIAGDIASGDYTLLKRTDGTVGFAETDMDVLKDSLSIEGIIDPTRLNTLAWVDNELVLTIVDSTANSLTYTGGADLANISAFTWDTVNGDFDGNAIFANNDLVTFTGYTAATLEESISAGVVTLEDNAYLSIMGASTNTFSANRVIVGAGATLELGQTVLATALNVQGEATSNVIIDGSDMVANLADILDLSTFSGTLTYVNGTMTVAAASGFGAISQLTLGDATSDTATLSLGGITVDKQINVAGTAIVTSTSGTTTLGNITGDSGSLNLNGAIRLQGDVDYTGVINIVSGVTTFGSAEGSNENMAASLIDVRTGAQLTIWHGSGVYTGTDITLNATTMHSQDLDAGTGVQFGTLTVNGASIISHAWNGIFSFEELSGNGNIDFQANAGTGEDGQLTIKSVNKYTGTLNVSQGDVEDRLQFFEATFTQEEHSHMVVSATSGSEIELVKTTFESEDGSGKVSFSSVVEMWNVNTLNGGTLELAAYQFAEASESAALDLNGGRLNLIGEVLDSTHNRTITAGATTIGTTLDATEWKDDIVFDALAGEKTTIATEKAEGGAGATITLSGVLSGTGTISVTGGGTLVLSASNTMSGAIQVASVSTLKAEQADSLGTGAITNYGLILASNGLTVGGAQSIVNEGSMDLGGTLAINKTITNQGASASIELFANTVFDLNGVASDTTTNLGYTTYKLFDFTAGGTLDASAMGLTDGLLTYNSNVLLTDASLVDGYTWVLHDDGTITYGPRGILTWDGLTGEGGDGVWGADNVWDNSFGSDATFQDGDIVYFSKGAGTVTVAAEVTAASITITDADSTDANSVAYTFTDSAINGVTGLIVSETASATFNNSIDLSAAAVTVEDGSSLSFGTTIVIDSLSNTGSVSTTGSAGLTITQAVGDHGGTLDVAGDLILGGADTTATNTFVTLTVAGDVTNHSTLSIGDTSAITGTLSGGALIASGDTSVGGLGSALSAFTNGTGSFDVNSDMIVTGDFANAGTVDVAGALTLNTAEGSIIAGNAVTLNSSTANSLTALTMAADQNLSLNAKLTVTGALTGAGHLTLTTLDAPVTGFGGQQALLSAGSLTGVTSLQLALSDDYLLGLGLDDAQTMTLVELGADSGLDLTDLTFANGNSAPYTVGMTQYSFGIEDNNITLTATIVGNRWQSDEADMNWSSAGSWSVEVPSAIQNAIFDGAGLHLVFVDQVGASASEIRVAIKDGSDRETDGYAFSGETLTTGNLTLSSGLLEVGNTINIVDNNSATEKGALVIAGGELTIANNGAINAVSATVSASNSLAIETGASLTVTGALVATDATGITVSNDGSLKVGDGSQIDSFSGSGTLITQENASVNVTSLGDQSLDLSEGSTLSVATDTKLMGMSGTGSLELIDNGVIATDRKLAVDASAVITGGDVTAAMLEVSTGTNTLFDDLTVDSIHFANDLSSSDFYLGASSVSDSTGTGSVAVTMASANFFENAANGSYNFFEQNGGTVTWSSFALSQSVLDDIASAITQDQGNFTYRDILQTRDDEGNLTFIVQDTTGRTWDMDNDFAVTPTADPNIDDSLSQIAPIYDPANAGKMASYDVLDHVNKVVIGESKQVIDMTNLSGTGELILSNLSGDSASAELWIIGNGTDSVLLRNTTLSVVSGDINAKNVTLNVQNVGADNQLYAGMLNLDESTLDTGATGHITVQGLTNNSTTRASSTGAVVQGTVYVNGTGGDYTGGYGTGASIYAQAGAIQELKADAALTVGGTGGTLIITDATSAAQLGGIDSTGAHIIIDLTAATSESNAITLGSASSVTNGGSLTLSVNGDFLEEGDTVVAFAGEALTIDSGSTLTINALNFDESPAISAGGLIELIEFADGSSIADDSIVLDDILSKYYANVRYDSTLNMIVADFNTSFYSSNAMTGNGAAGFGLVTDAFVNLGISADSSSSSDLSKVMNALDEMISKSPLAADKLAAAIAGASVATQGMALQDDMERQLGSIRNRVGSPIASKVGYGQEDVVNGWINAEGNQAKLSGESTEAGYTMSNWGGTVGADFSLAKNTAFGVALTAMYGDLTSSDIDQLESDVSTYYLSFFAHTAVNEWNHKFIVSAGLADIDGSRTVHFDNNEYSADYSTSGYSLGVQYELARHYYLNEEKSTLWQPLASISYQMSQIDGYTESGSDAALKVDEQSMHRATLALGARLQMNIGETMYNRTGSVSMRALLKGDIGDTRSDTEVALSGGTQNAKIQSSERGNFGVEVGAGLNIPISEGESSIFCDAAVELRENYSNVNATVGYRFSF